jgi:predicted transcriptional regulator
MSPELAVAIWREREETLDAIREGLADVEAGRTFPAEEVIRQLRAELHEA